MRFLQPPRHAGNTGVRGRGEEAPAFNPRDTRGIQPIDRARQELLPSTPATRGEYLCSVRE